MTVRVLVGAMNPAEEDEPDRTDTRAKTCARFRRFVSGNCQWAYKDSVFHYISPVGHIPLSYLTFNPTERYRLLFLDTPMLWGQGPPTSREIMTRTGLQYLNMIGHSCSLHTTVCPQPFTVHTANKFILVSRTGWSDSVVSPLLLLS